MVGGSRAGSPVQIALVQNKRLVIRSEALEEVLCKAGSNPVSIVSINGPLRTGKSYMLGHFLHYLQRQSGQPPSVSEFPWRNSPEGHTTGVYLWSEPLWVAREPSSGGPVAVLLLDTQGCFDSKASISENALIFAFSCLLSSVLIFNVSKQLTEDILEFLQVFVAGARRLAGLDSSDKFSKLVFLVRDWQFIKEYPCCYYDQSPHATERNFLLDKVLTRPRMTRDARTVHDDILSSFHSVACCLLPYPGEDLAIHDRPHCLRPEFSQAVDAFLPKILDADNIVTRKSVAGREVTAKQLIPAVRDWTRAFMEMEVLPAKFAVDVQSRPLSADTTERRFDGHAHHAALSCYRNRMERLDFVNGLQPEKLQEAHGQALVEATVVFEKVKRSQDGNSESFEDLCKSIEKQYQAYVRQNRKSLRNKESVMRKSDKWEECGISRNRGKANSVVSVDDMLDIKLDTLKFDVVQQVVDALRKEHASDLRRMDKLHKELAEVKEELKRPQSTLSINDPNYIMNLDCPPKSPKKGGWRKKRHSVAGERSNKGDKKKKTKNVCVIL